ncbi:MAG: putative sodium/hexose cotransport protein [Cytophagales bacterium]|jgi:SSS family solute:Na+ symporter|nr:sodium/sugar symporter [Bacteroidota bacterium]MBS1980295.1 sodium/sugar symporter [Bacteroidota bacterium]WHZ08821.1 MAG: putative sodium/hexose cotransport protein [Cytophagales bacterium]
MKTSDYIVFVIYLFVVGSYGYWIYTRKKKAAADSKDFFLAEGSLTWWAIGASLIASNISAEQFIGMSGSGFAMGLAIASYEWMAAVTLIVVAVFFLPIYLKNKIYTMPQFLAQRYSPLVATIMAVFWLLVYIFVNLTSILYLGALAVDTVTGLGFTTCVIGLSVLAIIITLGGMKVIGFTDVIQVLVLVMGGLATTYLAFDLVSEKLSGGDIWNAISFVHKSASDHFHMILDKGQVMMSDGKGGMEDAYQKLPGLAVLIGAMWIANLYYWGCNQYITQRALGADLETGRAGLLFASFLKLLMPIIVVLPGIAAFVLYKNGYFQTEMMTTIQVGSETKEVLRSDRAYPVLLNLLPTGLKGLSFAALTAAIVASLAGKANSISTIFTLDLYKKFFNKNASERHLVNVGKVAIIGSMLIAIVMAPQLSRFDQAFQFIQDFTGLISPGVVAIFLLGMFWKRANGVAALVAALATLPLGIAFNSWLPNIPFLHRMGYVFLILVGLMVIISLVSPRKENQASVEVDTKMFSVDKKFGLGALLVMGLITALYIAFW